MSVVGGSADGRLREVAAAALEELRRWRTAEALLAAAASAWPQAGYASARGGGRRKFKNQLRGSREGLQAQLAEAVAEADRAGLEAERGLPALVAALRRANEANKRR